MLVSRAWWCLCVGGVVVVAAAVAAVVGATCWHMAYQEASLKAAQRQKHALRHASRACNTYVANVLRQEQEGRFVRHLDEDNRGGSERRNAREASCRGRAGNLSVAVVVEEGQREAMEAVVKVAVADFTDRHGINVNLIWLTQIPEDGWVVRQGEAGVGVVVGQNEAEMVVTRQGTGREQTTHPLFLVLYPPAPVHTMMTKEKRWSKKYTLVNLNPFPHRFFDAILQGGVNTLQPLLPQGSAEQQLEKSIRELDWAANGLKVLDTIYFNSSMPAHEIWASVRLKSSSEDDVGILTWAKPQMLNELLHSGGRRVAWFLVMDETSASLFLKKTGIADNWNYTTWPNVTIIQYNGASIYNTDWYINILSSMKNKTNIHDPTKTVFARVYDSITLASYIGKILINSNNASVSELVLKIRKESFMLTGLTGPLDLTEQLTRSQTSYTLITCSFMQNTEKWMSSQCQKINRLSRPASQFTVSHSFFTPETTD